MIRNLYPEVPDSAEALQNFKPLKQSKTKMNQFQTEPGPEHLHRNIRRPHTQERWPHNFSPM